MAQSFVNLLTLPDDMPTAFVCNCDLSAGMLINKLRQNGYRVPEDVSVVGYDNYIYPGICDIGITTYEVDLGEMAKRTVKVLLSKLQCKSFTGNAMLPRCQEYILKWENMRFQLLSTGGGLIWISFLSCRGGVLIRTIVSDGICA